MFGLRRISRSLLLGGALLVSLSGRPATAAPLQAGTHYVPGATTLSWIRLSPSNPRTIYAGGTFADGGGAKVWLTRSTDGGMTWLDLSDLAGFYNYFQCGGGACSSAFDTNPIVIAGDGSHLYATGEATGPSPASGASFLYLSSDRGRSWVVTDTNVDSDCYDSQYGAGPRSVFASPVDPARVYALISCGGDTTIIIKSSSDSGGHWRKGPTSPLSSEFSGYTDTIDSLVVDPLRATTVYANLRGNAGTTAMRSDDAGITWTALVTPTATPAVTSFAVSIDPRAPDQLEATITDTGQDSLGQIFFSSDQGRSWSPALCPGVLHHTCPTLTVANGFGSGHNYALFPDGIHAFDGSGPSGPRLSLSDTLPVPPARIVDIERGTKADSPIYLQGKGQNGTVNGVLYRSTDAGATWQTLPVGLFPPTPTPAIMAGSLTVPHAAHRVAAPFIATYRKLGTMVIGLPITDAFLDGTVLVQYFEHMRLQLKGRNVVISELGSLLHGIDGAFNYGNQCLTCPNEDHTSLRLHIFKVSKGGTFIHAVGGDFQQFWTAHGGATVLGAPIGPPFKAENGDGSKRVYTMQYFEHVRLELHPESTNPAYRIELGLLGDQYRTDLGWLQAK